MKAFKWYRRLLGGVWYLNLISIGGFYFFIWSRKKKYNKLGDSLAIKKVTYIKTNKT